MTRRKARNSVRLTGAGLVALTLALSAACSSSSSDSGGNSSSTGGGGADKSPIVIGGAAATTGQGYNEPALQGGLTAAIDSINAGGGINGHPVDLKFCDTQFMAAAEISCARELVSKKVAAVIEPEFLADTSGTAYKILDKAKLAQVGTTGSLPSTLNDPYSYPSSSGEPGWFYGVAAALVSGGAKKIAVVDAANEPSALFSSQLVITALKSVGIDTVAHVTWDPQADPTAASAASKIVGTGADGISLAMANQLMPRIVKSLNQAGYAGKMATVASIIPPDTIKQIGPPAEGMLATSQLAFTTDTSNPAVARFRNDMKTYQPKSPVEDIAMQAWTGMQIFAAVLKAQKVTTFDAATIKQALDSLSTPVDVGTAAPWAVVGRTSPYPSFPRVLNPTVAIGVVKNGAVQPDGKGFVSPVALLNAAKEG